MKINISDLEAKLPNCTIENEGSSIFITASNGSLESIPNDLNKALSYLTDPHYPNRAVSAPVGFPGKAGIHACNIKDALEAMLPVSEKPVTIPNYGSYHHIPNAVTP